MTLAALLEDFGDRNTQQLVFSDQAFEEHKLEAFERGYRAGWDDASEAYVTGQTHVGLELGKTLQDLSFTFAEAQAAMHRNLAPLFTAILETILPQLIRVSTAHRVIDEIANLAGEVGSDELVLCVAPDQVQAVKGLLPKDTDNETVISGDDSLGAGQAILRIGPRERAIDIDQVVREISAKISGFFDSAVKEQHYA